MFAIISILAPARGATEGSGSPSASAPSISILAPARGATQPVYDAPHHPHDFNSRPCERGDQPRTAWRSRGRRFQFSPLREGRRWHDAQREQGGIFQFSPLREGRPVLFSVIVKAFKISILAPARGATKRYPAHCKQYVISILAPARGATWTRTTD